MGRVGTDRLAQGITVSGGGGGGGNSNMETVIQNLVSGANDVPHTLAAAPTAWLIQDSSGRTLTYAAQPKTGSETTVLLVTALTPITNSRITLFTEAS